MSLTQQFLLISILPLSFLGMALYVWRSGLKRRELLYRWLFALLAAAVWASSVLRFYGGATTPISVTFTWGVVGAYAFSVTAVAVLLATLSHLSALRQYGRFALGLSLILSAVAFFLDYQIWPNRIPDFILAGQTICQFDLWAATWIAGWLISLVAAWILTRQVKTNFPNSLYRNQIHYWLLGLLLFMIGGGFASVQSPSGQPGWQETGLLIVILAAFIGTISVTHTYLPDLQVALRQLFIRLAGSLSIFGLTWLVLSFIVRSVTNLPADTSPNLVLFLAAALFAGLFTFIYRLINELIRRLFSPKLSRQEATLLERSNSADSLPEPEQLAQLFLQVVQSELGTNDAWVFTAEGGVGERLALRPLASLGNYSLEATTFAEDSLFAAYVRQNRMPLMQYDMDTLSSFDDMPAAERDRLSSWKRILYMPLHAGNNLVGLLALGQKAAGESYNRQDFACLQSLAAEVSPLLAQAQNFAGLRQENSRTFAQNQALAHEKQDLYELLNLHEQFVSMVSPELRRPFTAISQEIARLQTGLAEHEQDSQPIAALKQQIAELQTAIENFIMIAGRLQSREPIHFQPVDLDEITQQAIRSLRTMAEARRVQVAYDPIRTLPLIIGDADLLQEAIQHLLHNAIKYNKIDGNVTLKYDVNDDQICLRMKDTGVGIPQERLASLWQGLRLTGNGNGRKPGLGLPLAQYIIAAHGGRVEAESSYGSGSIFSIYLPVASNEE